VSLAPEGGAHQSIKTPSIGLEQPGCVSYEPAFAIEVEWTLLASMTTLGRPGARSAYLRLSTRPVDQALANVPADPVARERRRKQVIAGGYPLLRRPAAPAVTICAMGAVVPEAVAAADRLAELGHRADVVVVTSPSLLFEAMQARRGLADAPTWILEALFPPERAAPMVTVLDGHPHTLTFLAALNRVRAAHLGVTSFGQSGDLASVYRHHRIDADSIVTTVLDLVD
jgi:pyruvate dehydrogenase E1 component